MHWPDSESLQVMTIISMDPTQHFSSAKIAALKKPKYVFILKSPDWKTDFLAKKYSKPGRASFFSTPEVIYNRKQAETGEEDTKDKWGWRKEGGERNAMLSYCTAIKYVPVLLYGYLEHPRVRVTAH